MPSAALVLARPRGAVNSRREGISAKQRGIYLVTASVSGNRVESGVQEMGSTAERKHMVRYLGYWLTADFQPAAGRLNVWVKVLYSNAVLQKMQAESWPTYR